MIVVTLAARSRTRSEFQGSCLRLEKSKMIIPGVAEWPSQGRLLGDVIGWHINLRKGAQCSFYSLKWMNFTLPSDPPLLKLEYLKIHCL